MFGINWNDPQTLWLNYTNLGLGIVVLICFAVVGYGFYLEVAARFRKALRHSAGSLAASPHTFHSPELGLTMADGGEPETPKPQPKPRKN